MKKGYLLCVPWELHYHGGVNHVVLSLYKELAKSSKYKPSVHVCLDKLENEQQSPVECSNSAFPFIYEGTYWFKKVFKYFLLFPLQLIIWNFRLLLNNIDCINMHYLTQSSYFLCLLKKYSIKKFTLIFSLHGTDLLEVKKGKNYWQDRFTDVDTIVTCSDYLRDEFLESFPHLANKTVTIHNGTSLCSSVDESQALLTKNEEFLISVGTFNQDKGHRILIEAFAELVKNDEVPLSLKLIHIGRKTEYLDDLKQLVMNYDLNHRVYFYTDIPNPQVLATIKHAKLFLLASKREAFGLVALEAGIVSTPLLVFNTGGLSEFINHGVSGTLLEDNSVKSWQVEIKNALDNISYHKGLAQNFKKVIDSEFSWKECTKKYCQQIRYYRTGFKLGL